MVTGSSGGIGRGITKRLAQEEAYIYVHYEIRRKGAYETRDAIRDAGGVGGLGVLKCDFRKDDNIQRLFEEALGEDATLDVLVNNAGMITKCTQR